MERPLLTRPEPEHTVEWPRWSDAEAPGPASEQDRAGFGPIPRYRQVRPRSIVVWRGCRLCRDVLHGARWPGRERIVPPRKGWSCASPQVALGQQAHRGAAPHAVTTSHRSQCGLNLRPERTRRRTQTHNHARLFLRQHLRYCVQMRTRFPTSALDRVAKAMEDFEASESVANTGTGSRREGDQFERLVAEYWMPCASTSRPRAQLQTRCVDLASDTGRG